MNQSLQEEKIGLVLTGGGARGAYQAGVLHGIADICDTLKIANPFNIISGCSAGSINAAYIAANCHRMKQGASELAAFWSQLKTKEIFRTDVFSLGSIGSKIITDVALGGIRKKKKARSLLNTNPLKDLVGKYVQFPQIRENIESIFEKKKALCSVVLGPQSQYFSLKCDFFNLARPNS